MEFGTAVHDSDFGRAILFLESRGASVDTDGMWQVRTDKFLGCRLLCFKIFLLTNNIEMLFLFLIKF